MDLTELLNYPSRISIKMLLNSEPVAEYEDRLPLKRPDSPSSTYLSGPAIKRRRLNHIHQGYTVTSPVCIQSCSPSAVIENFIDAPISPSRFSTLNSESSTLARSRIVGLRHRGNEIIRKEQLEMDISAYKQENEVLLRKIEEEKLRSRTSPISMIESSMENLRISNPSSNILGRSRISGESALLLLEVIALRRNLVQFRLYPSSSPKSVLNCPEATDIEQAIRCRTWNSRFIQIHARWAQEETRSMLTEEKEESVKICVRCKKLRKAGNRHPRSRCDDGFKVGSKIPYRDKRITGLYVTLNNWVLGIAIRLRNKFAFPSSSH